MKKGLLIILSAFSLLAGRSAYAQLDVTNTGIVYIGSATDTFFVSGAFSNTSVAAFSNNGILQVKKNLTNDQAAMNAGEGTLYLNGSSLQNVSGSQTFKTYNLFSNNTSGITLNNNLSVSGIHTFSSGMITTSATPNYMIYEVGSSYTGDGDSKHINGWVKKTGSTDFIFPVGNASYERTIALTSLTATGEFNITYNGPITPNRNSLYGPLVYIDTSEYWTINKISGSAAKVGMNWDKSKVRFPLLMLSDIRVAYFDGTFWNSIGGSATGSASTTGSLTSNSVTAFNNNFTFGSIATVLPLQIISFGATRMDEYTTINWAISNELNVDHYDLQRSDDGLNFHNISIQYPYNMNRTEFYTYDDRAALYGRAYYRLRSVAISAEEKYSAIAMVSSATNNDKLFYVIKNPVTTSIDIYAAGSFKGVYTYTIVNTAGQVVQSGTLEIKNEGLQTIKLQSRFPSGVYLLVIRNTEHLLQKSILKD